MNYDVKVIKGTVFDGACEYKKGEVIPGVDDDTYEHLCLSENPCCEMFSCSNGIEDAKEPENMDEPENKQETKKPDASSSKKADAKKKKADAAPNTDMPE